MSKPKTDPRAAAMEQAQDRAVVERVFARAAELTGADPAALLTFARNLCGRRPHPHGDARAAACLVSLRRLDNNASRLARALGVSVSTAQQWVARGRAQAEAARLARGQQPQPTP